MRKSVRSGLRSFTPTGLVLSTLFLALSSTNVLMRRPTPASPAQSLIPVVRLFPMPP